MVQTLLRVFMTLFKEDDIFVVDQPVGSMDL